MVVFDCFLYSNEKEMLELRLNELNDIVDKFIIVEGTTTFQGDEKPLLLKELLDNKDPIIEPFIDKIVHVVADLRDYSGSWNREFAQRNHLSRVLDIARPDDLILLSDCDEIPSKSCIEKQINEEIEYIVYSQYYYYYSFRYMKVVPWQGTAGILARLLKDNSPQSIRNHREVSPRLPNAGWHCSYFMSPEKIVEKIKSQSHTECITEENTNVEVIRRRIENGEDIIGRDSPFETLIRVYNPSVPDTVKNNMEKYRKWL